MPPEISNVIESSGKFFLLGRSMVETFDPADNSVELCFSSGAAGVRYDRYGEPYIEELEISYEAIESEFLRSGQMAHLLNHDWYDVNSQIGVVLPDTFRIENGKAYVRSRLTDRVDREGLVGDIKKGLIRNISAGYTPKAYKDITGPTDTMRRFLVVKWEPLEVSSITIPFDKIAATRNQNQPEQIKIPIIARNQTTNGGNEMPPVEPATPNPQPPVDTEAIARAAAAAEQVRIDEIDRIVSRMNLSAEFRSKAVKDNLSVDKVRAMAIEEFNAQPAPASAAPAISTRIAVGEDLTRAGRIEGLQNALLHRIDARKYELSETGKQYRGMSLLRMSEEVIGGRHGLTNHQIAARALTTSDLSQALGGSVKRLVLEAYKLQAQTFTPFVKFVSLSDYKEIKMIRTSSAPELKAVTEKGEYEEGLIGEGSEALKVARFGRILHITEETIVNDDLMLLSDLPTLFGSSSARLRSRMVYAKLEGSHIMKDQKELFSAEHGNLGDAADVNEDSLDLGRIAMRQQTEGIGESKEALGIEPKYLIVGPLKEKAARKTLATAILPGKSADVNTMQGAFDLIVASHITGKKFFLAADPSVAPGIVVATLEGMSGPEVETKENFESDGLKIKCKDVFGVGVADYRALWKNPGQ